MKPRRPDSDALQWSRQSRRIERIERACRGTIAVRVYNDANVAIGTGAVTAVAFNSERYDSSGFHSISSNTSRLTAPVTGLYHIGASIRFAANSTGIREAFLRVNGSTQIDYVGDDDPGASPVYLKLGTDYELAAGDYVEVVVFQSSGGNLDVVAAANSSPEFWMRMVGDLS